MSTPMMWPVGPTLPAAKKQSKPLPEPRVDYTLPGLHVAQREGVGHAGKGLDSLVGHAIHGFGVIA